MGSGTQSDFNPCNPLREGNEKDICIIETFHTAAGGKDWGIS